MASSGPIPYVIRPRLGRVPREGAKSAKRRPTLKSGGRARRHRARFPVPGKNKQLAQGTVEGSPPVCMAHRQRVVPCTLKGAVESGNSELNLVCTAARVVVRRRGGWKSLEQIALCRTHPKMQGMHEREASGAREVDRGFR